MNLERRESYERVLGTLATGEVVLDRPRSHLKDDPSLSERLPEALRSVQGDGQELISQAIDFGKFIGTSDCVSVTDEDQVFLAYRKGRMGPTRFVLNRIPEPSTELSVVLKKVAPKKYILLTAYVGPLAPPEPWDPNATEASIEFWNNHALVWDGEAEVLPETE